MSSNILQGIFILYIIWIFIISCLPTSTGQFDAYFTLQNIWGRLPQPGLRSMMQCISTDEKPNKIKFSRKLDTGQGPQLPEFSQQFLQGKPLHARIFLMPSDDKLSRFGAFQCKVVNRGITTEIVTLKLPPEELVELDAVSPYIVRNLGDDVELEVTVRKQLKLELRWLHNGKPTPESWNNKLKISLTDLSKSDAGVYECFYEDQRSKGVHAIMRLIVRGCPPDFYGEDCDKECPPCYNGGICHDKWGVCVCPAGFTGLNCEQACGGNRFGADCSKLCTPPQNKNHNDEGCALHLFCKPDPYGCSCAPGFKGSECMDHCEPGTYGADCKQPCHCAFGSSACNRITGACKGGCAKGWTGNSCEIYASDSVTPFFIETTTMAHCPVGQYGANCEKSCHCAGNEMCHIVTGRCPLGCEDGWTGTSCSECKSGRFGDNCQFVCHCRGGNHNCDKEGFCRTGCEAGWAGFTCQQECASGRFGPNCASACHCLEGPDVCNKITGFCEGDCEAGYMDKDCQTFCPQQYYGINCLNKCECFNGGHCNRIDGTCNCEGRWRGLACNESEPQIIAVSEEEINIGQQAYISCTADAVPEPEITLTSNLFPDMTFTIRSLEENQYQAVTKVKPLKSGDIEFVCSAKNQHDFDRKIITLSVIDPPRLINKPNIVEVTNKSVEIEWHRWTFGSDIGGKISDQIEYLVVYRTSGSTVWRKYGNWQLLNSALIDNLKPNQEYEFAVRCKRPGNGGDGEPSPHIIVKTKCGIPLPEAIPQGFLPESTQTNSIHLTWKAPSEVLLQCPLVGYLLTYFKNSDPSVQQSIDIKNTVDNKAELKNLLTYTAYTVHLYPVTSDGPSKYFAELVIRTLGLVPGTVQDLVHEPVEQSDLLVITWTPPTITNGQITAYIVSYVLTNRGHCGEVLEDENLKNEQTVHTTETEVTLQNLFAYSIYSVSVKTENHFGESNSETIFATTAEDGPDIAPPNLRVTAVTSTSIEYHWDPIPCKHANGIIIEYKYSLVVSELMEPLEVPSYKRRKRDSDIEFGSTFKTVKDLKIVVKDLQPYVEYGFAVKGCTKVSCGPATHYIFHRTAEGAPTSPLNFTVEAISSTSVTLLWVQPLPANGVVHGYQIQCQEKNFSSPLFIRFNVSDSNVDSQKLTGSIEGLKPAMDYVFKIQASTNAGWGEWSNELRIRTLDDVPDAPSNLMLVAKNETELTVSWMLPSITNGIIVGYKVTYWPVASLDPEFNFSSLPSVELPTDSETTFVTLKDLHPSTEYMIHVQAKTTVGYGSEAPIRCWTSVSGNFFPTVRTDMEATNETIPITFSTVKKSSVYKYQVIVENFHNSEPIDENQLSDYETAVVKNELPYYIAAELDPENVSDSGEQIFVVGDRKVWGGYKNVHLNPGHHYRIRIRTIIKKGKEMKSFFSQKKEHSTGPAVVPFNYKSKREIFGMNIIMFVLIVVSVIVSIIITVFCITFLFFQKKQKKKSNEMEFSNHDSKLSESQTWSVMYKVSENEAVDGPLVADGCKFVPTFDKAPSLKKNKSDKLGHGIKTENLADYLNNPSTSSRLSEQFKQLAAGQMSSWTVARKSENLKKNRYGNILPYDRSRVVLQPEPNSSDSDYINASYVDGYRRPREYIVTQGPLESTIADFWRMVWQENVPLIVMVTNLIENGKQKCCKYWPDESMMIGNLQILLLHTEECTDFVIRTILIGKVNEGKTHRVEQYQYTGWLDRTIPANPCFLIKMIKRIRDDHPVLGGPMIVHCSAGAGRSGTYIALDALLQQAEAEKRVDIFQFINNARLQRINLVQTMEQYLFIHEALLEALHYEDTTVKLDEIAFHLKELCGSTTLDRKSVIRRQFQMLKKTQKPVDVNCCSVALSETNVFKNRDPMTIPADSARVKLFSETETDNIDIYINAVPVDGYKQKNSYLVTQMPMYHTVEDFWLMIYQYKSSVIVMLNDNNDDDISDFCSYWPESGYGNYGQFEVQIVTFENHDEYKIRIMKLINSRQPSEDPQKVVQLQYKGWSSGYHTPESPNSVLKLLHAVNLWHQRSGNGPITIHCTNGATKSGLFCAIAYICDQIKIDQILDVYQAVKHIRANRPEFIQSMEQFKFCFEVANEAAKSSSQTLKSSSDYSRVTSYKV